MHRTRGTTIRRLLVLLLVAAPTVVHSGLLTGWPAPQIQPDDAQADWYLGFVDGSGSGLPPGLRLASAAEQWFQHVLASGLALLLLAVAFATARDGARIGPRWAVAGIGLLAAAAAGTAISVGPGSTLRAGMLATAACYAVAAAVLVLAPGGSRTSPPQPAAGAQ